MFHYISCAALPPLNKHYHNHKYRAQDFSKNYKKIVSYIPEQGNWSAWDGTYWDMKPETEITHVVEEVMHFND